MDIGKQIEKPIEIPKQQPGVPIQNEPPVKPQEAPILIPDWPVRMPLPMPNTRE